MVSEISKARKLRLSILVGGNLFLEGKEKQGFEWTKKASFDGSSDAQFNLAIMYKNGQGTEKDIVQSMIWFIISATNGNEKAQRYIDQIKQKVSEESFQEFVQLTQEFVNNNPKTIR